MQRRRRTPSELLTQIDERELSSPTRINDQTNSVLHLSRRSRSALLKQLSEESAPEVKLTQKTPSSFRSKLSNAAQWLSGKFKRKSYCVPVNG